MAFWRLAQLFTAVLAGVQATQNLTAPRTHRQLAASAPGSVAVCYTPFHNTEYPLWGGSVDLTALKNAIDDDFRIMSKYFTHVRTYYAQHYGIEIAPIAAKYGVKLYLGAYLTYDSWWADEANAAANAIKNYASTVEVVLTGSENLVNFAQRSWDIINKINDIKSRAGSSASNVKYGTVQRINEYVDSSFDWDIQQLNQNLDILGVNIYPFFTNSYDGSKPTALLDAEWNQVTTKYPRDKIRLTETGYPTSGAPSSLSPNVYPGVEASYNYYQGVVNWTPTGYSDYPKFWFQAFDRRYGDPAATVDLERYFGFLTTEKWTKRDSYPLTLTTTTTLAASTTDSTSTSSCSVEEGQDYTGTDLGSKASSRAEACFGICNQFSGCGAFTWTSYNGGTCWLKSARGSPKANSGARSGVACKCNLGGLETGVDYTGNDVGSVAGANAEACISLCQSKSGCKAFSWSSYNGGTCWLKSAKGSTSSNSGATSGVIC